MYLDGHSYLMLTVPADRGGGAVQVAVDQAPANRTLTVFGLLMAAGCILGIGGAAALGRTVARAGLVPVQQLTKAVEDVAVTMDLNRPVPIHGVDEIARLGQSVNTMLAAIDAARQSQRTLVEDASHELRTPLTSIRTNIELLLAVERQPELAHRLPPEERAKLLRDLDAQVGELAALTTELVELAREETTREPAEDVELTDVVDAAIDRVRIRRPGGHVHHRPAAGHRARPAERAGADARQRPRQRREVEPAGRRRAHRAVAARTATGRCPAGGRPTPARASTPATCRTSSTVSTGPPPPGQCRAPASAWRSSRRPPPSTAAR